MAEAGTFTPTLAKAFRSKKTCKALSLKKVVESEDPVPPEYAMAGLMYKAFNSNEECESVGALTKWIMTTWSLFYMTENAYDADPNSKPYYLNVREFIANYVFPIQGINLCVTNMCGQPILYTTKPYQGLGSGPMNVESKELKDFQVQLTGDRVGYTPSQFTFVDDEGNAQEHNDIGAGSLFDLMCNSDRFTSQDWNSKTSQAKWKEVAQATVVPFSCVPDYKVIKMEQIGGAAPGSMRFLGMESEKCKETVCVYKFGLVEDKEYGYIVMNFAANSQSDSVRMKKGSFRTAGYRCSAALKAMSEWELFEAEEGTTKTFIPNEFSAALDILESNGEKDAKYEQNVWDGQFQA